ncbi:hypothetical protein FGB62_149g013 [Gracilaria domingensis]|nr:hypothetical protein FGB62_149g013 [Gracilaria domingensis]
MGAPSAPPMAPSVFNGYPPSFAPPAPYYAVGYDTRAVENTFVSHPRAMPQMAYSQLGGAYWGGEQQSVDMTSPMLPPNLESAAAAQPHGMRGPPPVQQALEDVRKEAMQEARNMFKKFDVDDGGYLDLQEFMDAFRALKLAITYHEAMACFAMADQNEDGRISEEEFMHTYAEQMVSVAVAAAAARQAAAMAGRASGGADASGRYGGGAGAPKHRHGMGPPRPSAGP